MDFSGGDADQRAGRNIPERIIERARRIHVRVDYFVISAATAAECRHVVKRRPLDRERMAEAIHLRHVNHDRVPAHRPGRSDLLRIEEPFARLWPRKPGID